MQTELSSFLVEITALIFKKKDEDGKSYILDSIQDKTGMKGTGIRFPMSSMSPLKDLCSILGVQSVVSCLNNNIFTDTHEPCSPLISAAALVTSTHVVSVGFAYSKSAKLIDIQPCCLYCMLQCYRQVDSPAGC